MLRGLDISSYQWPTPSLAGYDFIVVRHSIGRLRDSSFKGHMAAARDRGLEAHAYHFGKFGDPIAQAKVFLAACAETNPDALWLDLEAERGITPMTLDQAMRFMEYVESQGHEIGMYHSESGFPNVGNRKRWVAAWRANPPRIPWDVWQYRGAPLDLDYSKASFRKGWTMAEQTALDNVLTMARYVTTLASHPDKRAALIADLRTLAHNATEAADLLEGVQPKPEEPEIIVDPDPLGEGIEIGPEPPAAPKPTIPLEPTKAPAIVGLYQTSVPFRLTLGGHDALRYGSSGPAFVVVHGGPVPVGYPSQLADLGCRIAARGGQAFLIDYDATDWHHALADVATAILETPVRPVTVVGHSFGAWLAGIAVLREGVGDALVHVCGSLRADFGAGDEPDLLALAARRPGVPTSVVEGELDYIGGTPADRQAFVDELHKAGHPGVYVLTPGDHTGTVLTDAALDAMFATAAMI